MRQDNSEVDLQNGIEVAQDIINELNQQVMAVKQIKGMKIRRLNSEDFKNVSVQHYDTGFTIWVNQPGLKGKRWIVDASQVMETGRINISPPYKHPNGDKIYGSLIDGDEIILVAIE